MATNKDIKDPLHRQILANELLVLRRVCREHGYSMKGDYFGGVVIGFKTALRRVEFVRTHDLAEGWK